MPPRPLIGLSVTLVVAAGCAPAMQVDSPDPPRANVEQCQELIETAPDTIAGAESREVRTSGVALAWGDPAITLRCGVPVPSGIEPGARCDTVEDVDWFTTRAEDGFRFDTIGRAATVELFVPFEYEPAGDALVDIAAAVRESVPVVERCR